MRLRISEVVIVIYVKSCNEAIFLHIDVAIYLGLILDTVLCQG